LDINSMGKLLHPIRIQIVKVLAKNKELTTRGLAEKIPDIPQASLYRHIKVMLKNGFLEISREQRIRGTTERYYKLKINPFEEIADRMNRLDKQDLLDLFTAFMIAELSDFAEYLGDDDYPVEKDRLGFASNSVYLDDEELKSFVAAITAVIKDYCQTETGFGRRLHKFSFSMIPTRKGKNES